MAGVRYKTYEIKYKTGWKSQGENFFFIALARGMKVSIRDWNCQWRL